MSGHAIIQKDRGEFINANGFNAWKGLDERGYEIQFFCWEEMRSGEVPVARGTITVGSVAFVRDALARLGIGPPSIDYPPELFRYLGRKVWQTTMGEVRSRIDAPAIPIFVKPVDDAKAFVGHLVSEFRDLIRTAGFPREMKLWASEPVTFASEWRFFVNHGKIIGVGHYQGVPPRFPDRGVVEGAIADFMPGSPVGYGIDFGVDSEGRSCLVEVNDGFALGCYGLGPLAYSKLLIDRWSELTALD